MVSKKGIVKKLVKRVTGPQNLAYTSLEEADKNLQNINPMHKRMIMPMGAEEDAFGSQLKDLKFKKGLRKLQEKYKMSQYA
jgi:hypothetical protein